MKQHSKNYGVYLWDTFDNQTILLFESNSLRKCFYYILAGYEKKIAGTGADKIEIVDAAGNVVLEAKIK